MASQSEMIPALIAEYNSIRSASLLRETNRNSLLQFEILLIAAIITGLPAIMDHGIWIALPGISILLLSLIGSSIQQSKLLFELARYEYNVLRPRLLAALGDPDIPGGATGIWDWQGFHMRFEMHPPKSRLRKFGVLAKNSLHGGSLRLEDVMAMFSGGLLGLFYYSHFAQSNSSEKVIFTIACGAFIWFVFGRVSHLLNRVN